jgi:hypothetical protein
MSRFDHTAFVNSRRDERSLGHHTVRNRRIATACLRGA